METPYGFFPDLYTQWGQGLAEMHFGETMVAENGRRQSMTFGPQYLRTFTAKFVDEPPVGVGALTAQQVRAAIRDFNRARGGAFGQSFYFWNPALELQDYPGVACGLATAQSTVIIPYRITNAAGSGLGAINDVRVAGVSQAFTIRHLLPAPRSFASIRFDGATGYITCGSQSSLRATGDMTLTAWVWRATDTLGYLVSNESTNASGTAVFIDVGGTLNVRTNQAGAAVLKTSAGNTVPLQTWTHVAVVKSGTNISFYINAAVASATTGLTNPVAATLPFLIGARSGSAGFFDGMLGHVRYYASALSSTEINNVFSGSATPTPNLKGWWRLNEGYGTATADISGSSGNGGTVTGTVPWVAGHEEIVFAGGAQTGAVTATLYGRELLVCGFAAEPMAQTFAPSGSDVTAAFALAIAERY